MGWPDRISSPSGSATESAEDSVRITLVAKRKFAKLDALGDGSTDPIYLRDQIVNRFGRATGRPGRSDRHMVCLEFRNSRCDRSWGGQIGSGPGGGTTESAEDSVRIVLVLKREFAELDALGDGSTDAIYLEE